MARYSVEIPIAGSMTIEVEADSEESAIEAGWARFHEEGPDAFDVSWEALSHVTNGNVCSAPCNEHSASEIP